MYKLQYRSKFELKRHLAKNVTILFSKNKTSIIFIIDKIFRQKVYLLLKSVSY